MRRKGADLHAGKGQGPWPDPERHRRAAALRARGLTLAEIGRLLGATRQAAHYWLTHPPRGHPGTVCRGCGGAAVPAGARLRERGEGLCPVCLRRRGATFARLLRAYRLAAGMTKAELGRRSGVVGSLLTDYEAGRSLPSSATLARLVAVLGAELLAARGARGSR